MNFFEAMEVLYKGAKVKPVGNYAAVELREQECLIGKKKTIELSLELDFSVLNAEEPTCYAMPFKDIVPMKWEIVEK